MGTSVLDSNSRKSILFDVVDGIPASDNESQEAALFRKEIEKDNRLLEFQAEELGLGNVLFEFASQG